MQPHRTVAVRLPRARHWGPAPAGAGVSLGPKEPRFSRRPPLGREERPPQAAAPSLDGHYGPHAAPLRGLRPLTAVYFESVSALDATMWCAKRSRAALPVLLLALAAAALLRLAGRQDAAAPRHCRCSRGHSSRFSRNLELSVAATRASAKLCAGEWVLD